MTTAPSASDSTPPSESPNSDASAAVATPPARLQLLAFVLFVLWLLGEWMARAGITEAPHLMHRFLAGALASITAIHLAVSRPAMVEVALTLALAIGSNVLRPTRDPALGPLANVLVNAGSAVGLASLVMLLVRSLFTTGASRDNARKAVFPALILPLYVLLSVPMVGLTTTLHPVTLDGLTFVADNTFGVQPSFVVARWFAALPALAAVCGFVYFALPVALAGLYVVKARRPNDRDTDALLVQFLALGAVALLVYHFYPLAGPRFAFGTHFPNDARGALERVLNSDVHVENASRNCMPSLHTGWALLLWFAARNERPALRASALLWLVFTELATLGRGYHYLVDLVVAVPFTVAVRVALLQVPASHRAFKRNVAIAGALTTFAWLMLLREGTHLLQLTPVLPWLLSIGTVVLFLTLEARATSVPHSDLPALTARAAATPVTTVTRGVATLFFLSGFAGLLYEVVFAKSLALTFGSTATASTTVLATYMGGMALGSWLGGRIGSRRADPVRIYALCEVGIGLWCAATPWMFRAVRSLYVTLAAGGDPARPSLVALQVALGALVLLPPTVLMGATMPVLLKYFETRTKALGEAVGLLYGSNTLGAALGAVTTGYALLPRLGVFRTTALAVVANISVGVLGALIARRLLGTGTKVDSTLSSSPSSSPAARSLQPLAVAVLGVGGVVTLALEVTYTHLLAVVAGNSAYAFSLMLFAFLLGLGGGATIGRRWLQQNRSPSLGLAVFQGLLAAAVLGGVWLWDGIPDYFATFRNFAPARSFESREFVRFAVCCLAMMPPALCIGASYPLAMECVARARPQDRVAALGRAAAINTLGNITGALSGSFLLLPWLGSLRTLHVLASTSIAIALFATLLSDARSRRIAFASVALAGTLLALQPRQFHLSRLASGANVYFTAQPYGEVIDHAESTDGGLTTVARSIDHTGRRTLTLLTNGKFQGDDSPAREMQAQFSFGLFPLLHTTARNRATVIGLGTGVTARAVHAAGFAQTDLVEMSGDIVRMARRYFASVNGRVLEEPSVRTHVTDGRNFLLLTQDRYDLISIEVSSIWFAGAASLYNREFYRLTRERLSPRGVLQQWVQLHRLAPEDLASILATLRSEYRHVWLYLAVNQGVLVACSHDCQPTREAIDALDARPALRDAMTLYGGGASRLLTARVLTTEGIDRFIRSRGEPAALMSTDDNLFLEYHTPRANVRAYRPSLDANVNMLRRFSPASLLEGTALQPEQAPELLNATPTRE